MASTDVHMVPSLKNLTTDYLNNLESDTTDFASKICSTLLNEKGKSLLDLVECLSGALTDTKVEMRMKGTSLLAELMHCCPPDGMNVKEVETFVMFFCDRIKDHHSIQPTVIYGFLGLVSYHEVHPESVIKMLQSLFSEVHVQSLIQADRRNVFNFFSNLLKTRISVLKTFSSDFVLGFIQAMDSERDPRNLLICFENSVLVLRHLNFLLFAEDFFEILSCYFPIDFTPPKGEQFHISKEELVLSLRKCLTETTIFAPYAIPVFIEKLSSDITSAKEDAIQTLTECLAIYSPNDIVMFINDIWLQIRKDYILSDTAELSSLYLKFVSSLVTCLLKADTMDHVDNLINLLVRDCKQTLRDPDMVIALQCSEIILSVSKVSLHVLLRILNDFLPNLNDTLQRFSSELQRLNLLEFTMRILQVGIFHKLPNTEFWTFVDQIIPILYDVLSNSHNEKLLAITLQCFESIILSLDLIPAFDVEISSLVNLDVLSQHLFKPLFSQKCSSEVIHSYNEVCKVIAKSKHEVLFNYILEMVRTHVTDIDVTKQTIHLLPSFMQYDKFCCNLLAFLSNMLVEEHKVSYNVNELALIILQTLINLLHTEKAIDCDTILPLMNAYLVKTVGLSNEVLNHLAICLCACYMKLDIDSREGYLKELIKSINNNYSLWSEFLKHSVDCETELRRLTVIYRSIVTQSSLQMLETVDVKSLLFGFVDLSEKNETDDFVLSQVGITIAILINKLPSYADLVLEKLKERLSKHTCDKATVNIICWITKALVMNWQPSTCKYIELLVKCFQDQSTGSFASEGFLIITTDQEGVLSKRYGAIIKLMHKQRFAQFVLPLLIAVYHQSEATSKAFAMTAISHTLQVMPKQMLQKHLEALVPLLMNSIATFTSEEILQATLSTLFSVLDHNKDVLLDHVSSLGPRLLPLVTHERMKIRIVSLRCLYIIASYQSYYVQPMKAEILRKLRPALDDRKRLVRQEAIKCSNAWHLLLE